jgi:hypothetical protein
MLYLLHRCLVLVDRLECGIVRDGAVAEGETPRMSDALCRGRALDDFGSLKKLLDLLFGQRRFICGARSKWQHNAGENGG